tara:strand:- start:286 stop:522 length:237 start_codon:yes stop_codon:yes gene_type:complete
MSPPRVTRLVDPFNVTSPPAVITPPVIIPFEPVKETALESEPVIAVAVRSPLPELMVKGVEEEREIAPVLKVRLSLLV